MEYTKGEWLRQGTTVYALNKLGYNRFYAGVFHGNTDTEAITSEEELIANARLIAAAPEMYEALKECVMKMEVVADEFNTSMMDSAIKNAMKILAELEGSHGS